MIEVVVEGVVDQHWRSRLGDLELTPLEGSGGRNTMMTGSVLDQAQLHAVLHAVRDLGLTLVSVRQRRK